MRRSATQPNTRFLPLSFEKAAFRRLRDDRSLPVPNTAITVFVPVGIVDHQKAATREKIVEAIRFWIADNRLHLRDGTHPYPCDLPGMSPVMLTVKRNKFHSPQGVVSVARQQVKNDLNKVIENALQKKLPKLVNTQADRHVLFLERNQFTFLPELIFKEIERQRPKFRLLLASVDEIWHVETPFYDQGGHVDFELWKGEQVLESMTFENCNLTGRSKGGMPYPV